MNIYILEYNYLKNIAVFTSYLFKCIHLYSHIVMKSEQIYITLFTRFYGFSFLSSANYFTSEATHRYWCIFHISRLSWNSSKQIPINVFVIFFFTSSPMCKFCNTIFRHQLSSLVMIFEKKSRSTCTCSFKSRHTSSRNSFSPSVIKPKQKFYCNCFIRNISLEIHRQELQ